MYISHELLHVIHTYGSWYTRMNIHNSWRSSWLIHMVRDTFDMSYITLVGRCRSMWTFFVTHMYGLWHIRHVIHDARRILSLDVMQHMNKSSYTREQVELHTWNGERVRVTNYIYEARTHDAFAMQSPVVMHYTNESSHAHEAMRECVSRTVDVRHEHEARTHVTHRSRSAWHTSASQTLCTRHELCHKLHVTFDTRRDTIARRDADSFTYMPLLITNLIYEARTTSRTTCCIWHTRRDVDSFIYMTPLIHMCSYIWMSRVSNMKALVTMQYVHEYMNIYILICMSIYHSYEFMTHSYEFMIRISHHDLYSFVYLIASISSQTYSSWHIHSYSSSHLFHTVRETYIHILIRISHRVYLVAMRYVNEYMNIYEYVKIHICSYVWMSRVSHMKALAVTRYVNEYHELYIWGTNYVTNYKLHMAHTCRDTVTRYVNEYIYIIVIYTRSYIPSRIAASVCHMQLIVRDIVRASYVKVVIRIYTNDISRISHRVYLIEFVNGVATISGLLKMIGLYCRILSLLYGSFAKETYNLEEPTDRSHPILHRASRRDIRESWLSHMYSYTHSHVSSSTHSHISTYTPSNIIRIYTNEHMKRHVNEYMNIYVNEYMNIYE